MTMEQDSDREYREEVLARSPFLRIFLEPKDEGLLDCGREGLVNEIEEHAAPQILGHVLIPFLTLSREYHIFNPQKNKKDELGALENLLLIGYESSSVADIMDFCFKDIIKAMDRKAELNEDLFFALSDDARRPYIEGFFTSIFETGHRIKENAQETKLRTEYGQVLNELPDFLDDK